MSTSPVEPDIAAFWTILGVAGSIIFYGRFYVQWIATEIRRRSVIPMAFWYMSVVGSICLFTFAVASRSPLGALGFSFNNVVYTRNLVHIWREQAELKKSADRALNALVALLVGGALLLVVFTWSQEYEVSQTLEPEQAAHNWFWLAVGVVGQILFATRFLVQWIVTEIRRKSTVPTVFWYLSLVAAALQISSFTQRREWVFAIGMAATLFIYARNLWFIHTQKQPSAVSTPGTHGGEG